jgi:hypothetical protein
MAFVIQMDLVSVVSPLCRELRNEWLLCFGSRKRELIIFDEQLLRDGSRCPFSQRLFSKQRKPDLSFLILDVIVTPPAWDLRRHSFPFQEPECLHVLSVRDGEGKQTHSCGMDCPFRRDEGSERPISI